MRLCKTNGSLDEALDQAVRGVVQDASGVFTEGLWEGVGHAACGFFFGRTLTFLLEQQNARTVASPLGKLLVPDMAVWRQIAEQSAWARSDTRTSELVLISAARFTNEQRVKAWAMCDYLFHWRPELLRELERSKTEQVRTPPEVEQEFQRRTGLSLETIDLEWRDFFGRNGELRAAMAADPLGDPKGRERKVREQSRAIVDLVNELRCASLRGPIGFHFAEDLGTAAALAYADDLARWEAEQKKPPASRSPKAPKTAPALPDAVGRTVLFARGADSAAAVSRWACRPAWRDTLLHPGRGLLGARQGGNGLAVDLTDPVAPVTSGLPLCWPRHRQAGVPGSAEVADLGPRVAAALAAVSPPPGPVVGMPITLHFHRELPETELAQVTAAVSADGRNRVGVLVPCQGRGPDDAVPGCVAFVPLEPLPSGAWVEVGWTLPGKLLGKGEHFPVVQFLVQ
ncbi:MAG: hypothetical protein FJ265_22585 [Planctomycetes bacterium]|nr:hypothetical protein [Planctomycetota bacterium]